MDKKISFAEIKADVIKRGFGVEPFEFKGVLCGMSMGIEKAIAGNAITASSVERALERFQAGDWGDFYDDLEDVVVAGREYGQYPSALGITPETGAIMVHWETSPLVPWSVVVYFQFER